MLLSSRYELATDDRDETCVDGDVCVVWEDDTGILGRYAYHFGCVLVDQELLSSWDVDEVSIDWRQVSAPSPDVTPFQHISESLMHKGLLSSNFD